MSARQQCDYCVEWLTPQGMCANEDCTSHDDPVFGMDYSEAMQLARVIGDEGYHVRGIQFAPNSDRGHMVSVAGNVKLTSARQWNDAARARAKLRRKQ